MPDPTPSSPSTPSSTPAAAAATPAASSKPPGYFNAGQLEDIKIGEDVSAAAKEHAAELLKRQITDLYIAGLDTALAAARRKTNETGQATDEAQAETLHATGSELLLITALHGIQSAAKQKHRMLEEDDDPATNFSTAGYLIGRRLNPSRALFLQNAEALIAKATTDDLPGYDAAGLQLVRDAVTAYTSDTISQHTSEETRAKDKLERDALLRKINSRRMAIQHAADALFPYTVKTNRPVRKLFKIPQSRPFNG